jgi:hypothetical protein
LFFDHEILGVPMPETEISTTSPAVDQRAISNRAPAPVGVPVAITSPSFKALKV